MTDLSKTIAPKSDQINADDLIAGDKTIRITRVSADPGTPEQPISVNFDGDNGKPYKPCKSMRRVMVTLWGSDGATYTGRWLILYRDPDVQFGGMKVGGIRIRAMSHIDRDQVLALTAAKARRAAYTVKKFTPPADKPTTQGPDPLALARSKARLGKAPFITWWNSDEGKDARANGAQAIIDELRGICAEADKAIEEDPFGLPPIGPTEADLARAEAEARAEADRQAVEE